MSVAIKHFDVHQYIKSAKALGISEDIAEFQALEIKKAKDDVIKNKESITKLDLKTLEVRFIKWLLTIGSAVIVFILGITGYELNNIRTGIQDIHTEIADVKKDIADIESSISILVPHPDRNGVHETI